ncbi:MAG: SDR family NAD(P)-dependent oxidoreductase [Deltaproteobacteria bacterium]|nr:SDR family NAD(P)-dependent oxidoreductase [Deltaproteobacteria bacterium]
MALAFDAEGARLSLGARTSPEIDELAQQCHDAIAVQTDVRIAGEVQSLIDATVGEFGRIDVMINNAGLAVYGAVGTYTPNEIEAILDTNVKGVIHGCQAAFNVMKEQRGGFIINISSIAGSCTCPTRACTAPPSGPSPATPGSWRWRPANTTSACVTSAPAASTRRSGPPKRCCPSPATSTPSATLCALRRSPGPWWSWSAPLAPTS